MIRKNRRQYIHLEKSNLNLSQNILLSSAVITEKKYKIIIQFES